VTVSAEITPDSPGNKQIILAAWGDSTDETQASNGSQNTPNGVYEAVCQVGVDPAGGLSRPVAALAT
jgi:hypothetical protein